MKAGHSVNLIIYDLTNRFYLWSLGFYSSLTVMVSDLGTVCGLSNRLSRPGMVLVNHSFFHSYLFSTVWVSTMMDVGQAISVPIVDPSGYQTPLMGAVSTRKGMSGNLSWVLFVIWVIHIFWLASGPGRERFQWNLPYYFHISHFLPLVFKILPFTYFYSPRLLESGRHRKDMAKEVSGFKHTDTF